MEPIHKSELLVENEDSNNNGMGEDSMPGCQIGKLLSEIYDSIKKTRKCFFGPNSEVHTLVNIQLDGKVCI